MIHELHDMVARAAARIRTLRTSQALALCWLVYAAIAAALMLVLPPEAPQRAKAIGWVVIAALVSAFVVRRQTRRRAARDPRAVARRIERRHPDLGAALLAALEQVPTPRFKRLSYLQTSVVRAAVAHGRKHNWADATPVGSVRWARLGNLVAFALLMTACFLLASGRGAIATARLGAPAQELLPDGPLDVEILPGNAELERGATLVVIARFRGAVPPDATLSVINDEQSAAADATTANNSDADQPMTRSLDDPQFVARVPAVAGDLSYRVRYAGDESPIYRISVFDYPQLEQADAHLTFPKFTRLEPKLIEDVRQIAAVEGTQVKLMFRLNKSVADARLVERSGEEIELQSASDEPLVYETSITLDRSRRLKLRLVDAEGRKNKLPPDIILTATPNNLPEINVSRPARDVRVSPLEELQLAASASDDFGLVRAGLSYAIGGQAATEVVLFESDAAESSTDANKADLDRLLELETLDAAPDQVLSYYFWAEDHRTDGAPRRAMSPMYFAEVRRFEEIFREGQQPAGNQPQQSPSGAPQGSPAQQAEQLAELQKQIAAATWNLLRQGADKALAPKFIDDLKSIRESQQHVAHQLSPLQQSVEGDAKALLDEAANHVGRALDRLQEAASAAKNERKLAILEEALSAEQAAYQSLLKLRAREFDIVRSNSRQGSPSGGGGAAGPSQRQLSELELSPDDNRYESQSRATNARTPADQQRLDESRQMLNRLRDLARRQQDLNDRVRDVQSALQAAQDDERRREAERELKRLREQQQEILRDADQLKSDMDGAQDRQATEGARQELDKARDRVQDAAEALGEGRLADAVTQGARAGDQLTQLRDQMRRQTADRFTDEMRGLRDAARQLDERQQQLSQRLSELGDQRGRSLRSDDPRQGIAEEFSEQRRALDETLERMQQTVEEAEEPEPLLARQLYEGVQQAIDDPPQEALDVARQLAEAGATREASQAMRQADRGVRRLREAVDRAADGVLGGEVEALRRAGDELRDLADQINREIDANQPPGETEQGESDDDSAPGQQGSSNGSEDPQATGNRERPQSLRGEGGQGQSPEDSTDQPPGESPQGASRGAGSAESDDEPRDSPQSQDSPTASESQDSSDSPADGRGSAGETGEQSSEQPGAQPGSGGDGRQSQAESRSASGSAPADDAQDALAGFEQLFGGDGRGGPGRLPNGPITGEDFRRWADRMRDVEQLLDDANLRAEAARIRERAAEARAEFKRHSRLPDWTKLRDLVSTPLNELRVRIDEEIDHRESPDALAPIDRDSAPDDLADAIRLYYQRLGSGK